MRSILYFVAVCFTAAVLGCETTNTVSPGAVSECGAKVATPCTKDKSECCGAAKCDGSKDVAPGAVGEKSGCCASLECCKARAECEQRKAECQKAKEAEVAPGAVSEKSGCTKVKSECHHNKADGEKRCPFSGQTGTNCTKEAEVSPGAVSEKSGCAKVKTGCGAKSE